MENVLAVLNLGDFAQAFSKMGMFPVFDVAYYIVSILYLKYEPGECFHLLISNKTQSKSSCRYVSKCCILESFKWIHSVILVQSHIVTFPYKAWPVT